MYRAFECLIQWMLPISSFVCLQTDKKYHLWLTSVTTRGDSYPLSIKSWSTLLTNSDVRKLNGAICWTVTLKLLFFKNLFSTLCLFEHWNQNLSDSGAVVYSQFSHRAGVAMFLLKQPYSPKEEKPKKKNHNFDNIIHTCTLFFWKFNISKCIHLSTV